MRQFIHKPLLDLADFNKIATRHEIVYFLVYDSELEAAYEDILIAAIQPEAFEHLIKFHLNESGTLYKYYKKPPEFPVLGLWWQGVKGLLWAEQMRREPHDIQDLVANAREWRAQDMELHP